MVKDVLPLPSSKIDCFSDPIHQPHPDQPAFGPVFLWTLALANQASDHPLAKPGGLALREILEAGADAPGPFFNFYTLARKFCRPMAFFPDHFSRNFVPTGAFGRFQP